MHTFRRIVSGKKMVFLRLGAVALTLLLTTGLLSQAAFAQTTYVITDGDRVLVHTTYETDPAEVLSEAGLELGADDYITKPFSLGLVKLHIEAVLKRAGKMKNILDYGKIRIEKGRQLVYREDEILEMTRREYELLLYFMEHKETVLSRETILNAVWDYDYAGDVRTVDTLVKQIRKKLGDDCNYIHTVYGVGYLFEDKADER